MAELVEKGERGAEAKGWGKMVGRNVWVGEEEQKEKEEEKGEEKEEDRDRDIWFSLETDNLGNTLRCKASSSRTRSDHSMNMNNIRQK